MTTKITILNHGPDDIAITTLDKVADNNTFVATGTAFVRKNSFYTDQYVYDTRKFQITEIKEKDIVNLLP